MRAISISLAASALVVTGSLAATSARADGIYGVSAADESAPHNEVTIGGSTRALRSSSADALTPDSLDGGKLTYARRLDISPLERVGVWVEAGTAWGAATGSLFQTMSTQLDTLELRVGARAMYRLHRVLAVGGRLDLGSARASLKLQPSSGAELSDARWGGLVSTAATADVYLVANRRLSLGVRVELGYDKTTAIELHAHASPADDSTIRLPMAEASLGHLDLSGPSFSISALGRF